MASVFLSKFKFQNNGECSNFVVVLYVVSVFITVNKLKNSWKTRDQKIHLFQLKWLYTVCSSWNKQVGLHKNELNKNNCIRNYLFVSLFVCLLFKFPLKVLVKALPVEHIHKSWALLTKGRILVNESTLYICKIKCKLETNRTSSEARSSPRQRKLKTEISLWKSIKFFPSTLRRNNHRPFWICVWGKLGQGYHVIIVTSEFSKSSVFKIFPVHEKRKAGVFKFLRVEERFRKAPFSWRISVDGKPSHKNKTTFSNIFGVVWTGP